MNYSIVTQPSVEPISLTDAKTFLKVDGTSEDALITSLITAARVHFENETWMPLCTQTWKLNLDESEVKTYIGISKSPVQSITHIKYFDENEDQQTLSTGSFQTDVLNEPARIKILTMPNIYDRMNAMEIQFVCGYGVAASVPKPIIEALELLIGHWYQHREAAVAAGMGGIREVPLGYDRIINPYKNTWFYPY